MDSDYEIRRAAYEAVAVGDAEIVDVRDGEPIFALTASGRARAIGVIDRTILRYGHEAPERLAEALGVELEVGELLVSLGGQFSR